MCEAGSRAGHGAGAVGEPAAAASVCGAGARALEAQNKPTGERIDWLFRHALARLPSSTEKTILAEVASESAGSQEMEDLLWMVFMHPEFQIIR